MIQICESKYEQETSEQEYEFLKQQITCYNLPSQSFECSTISHHLFIDSIQNLTVQEALLISKFAFSFKINYVQYNSTKKKEQHPSNEQNYRLW